MVGRTVEVELKDSVAECSPHITATEYAEHRRILLIRYWITDTLHRRLQILYFALGVRKPLEIHSSYVVLMMVGEQMSAGEQAAYTKAPSKVRDVHI